MAFFLAERMKKPVSRCAAVYKESAGRLNGATLKNEGLLPLQKVPIALLGSGAVKPVKGGTGSGDVNCRRTVSIFEGFENAGVTLTSRGSCRASPGVCPIPW